MAFNELRHDQARQTVDVEQVFAAYSSVRHDLDKRYAGSMFWRDIDGRTYLYRKHGASNRSLGPKTNDLERVYEAFVDGRDTARARAKTLAARLNEMAPINVAMGLGRLPLLSARILRHAAAGELLGKAVIVVGTNALFAYERMAAVRLSSGLLSTGDIDLLFDARRKLKLAADVRLDGLLGILRKADRSFETSPGSYRAVNGSGFMVDLIEPSAKDRLRSRKRSSIGGEADLQAVEIEGLAWRINSPKRRVIVLDDRGFPVEMVVPDPRAFALHKAWLATRDDRDPIKRRRDLDQARLVARLAIERLALSFDSDDLSALPTELRRQAASLTLDAPMTDDLRPDW